VKVERGNVDRCAWGCRDAKPRQRIALIADGAIAAQGTPHEMMRAELIERCYGFAVRMLDAGADAPPVAVPA
jgi:iron complex transport system ATP-binding protein